MCSILLSTVLSRIIMNKFGYRLKRTTLLNPRSYPSSSLQGHMNWDTSMPANIGYIAGMLYNQNNVASEGGPITTLMELEVRCPIR